MLGDDQSLDWYEDQLKQCFEIKIRGRLGEGCPGAQQIQILNRKVTLTSGGLPYEADPRHIHLLMSSLSLTQANAASSPGVTPKDRDDTASKHDESADLSRLSPRDAIASICKASDSRNSCLDQNVDSNATAIVTSAVASMGSSVDAIPAMGIHSKSSKMRRAWKIVNIKTVRMKIVHIQNQ